MPLFFFQLLQPVSTCLNVFLLLTSHLHCTRAVNPLRLQMLRIGREEMIDDVITHRTWHHLYKKYCLVDSDCPEFVMTVTKCVKKMLLA